MAYVIAEPCIDNMDQSCVAVCPVDCITSVPGQDRKFYIDPSNCIECGACEQACPNEAIFRAGALPEPWAGFAWVDATWYVDPQQARDAIDAYLPAAPAA
jgi:NAD-dependent dihydropyrimidine dehydrogenase PreA subunit